MVVDNCADICFNYIQGVFMKQQLSSVHESMEASKVMLESGANNPITIRLLLGDQTVAYASSQLRNDEEVKNFVELLRYFTASYKEIDGACISAIATIAEVESKNQAPKKAVIGAYRNRAGGNVAYAQEFDIIADEVFFGETGRVKGKHNFCKFLDTAFADR